MYESTKKTSLNNDKLGSGSIPKGQSITITKQQDKIQPTKGECAC